MNLPVLSKICRAHKYQFHAYIVGGIVYFAVISISLKIRGGIIKIVACKVHGCYCPSFFFFFRYEMTPLLFTWNFQKCHGHAYNYLPSIMGTVFMVYLLVASGGFESPTQLMWFIMCWIISTCTKHDLTSPVWWVHACAKTNLR